MIPGLFGMRVIRDAKMVQDSGQRSWAKVRSHGRARRRLKRGFRQNIDIIWEPKPDVIVAGDMIVGHPDTIQKMLVAIEAQGKRP